ncbi:MAG: type II toxin-antitoxin system prevent-host-death family antitoxin [Gemmatimonadetes bacterium]|nr:type II toxin-antitoxin system prevent-host-death family antitoxin [Gemmatimonadota bacterium]NNK64993.1 type II toxin-antitoxin system prevent-host-death family antitoxin [Gemmatimonadota bacterium]
MTTVGAYEAKTHLADLLRRVEAGERIRITRNGRPIADLVPADPSLTASPDDVVDRLLDFRRGRPLGPDLTIRDLIEAGRGPRDATP